MRVLFNCTTNLIGGAVKNSAIFIKCVNDQSDVFVHFAVSLPVKDLLDRWGVKIHRMTVFSATPSKSFAARRFLKSLVLEYDIDMVYTMAGPSYVNFPVTHVQGISNPHVSHPNYVDIRSVISFWDFMPYLLQSAYQKNKAKCADYFIFQTNSSMRQFCCRTGISPEKCTVISNAVDLENFGPSGPISDSQRLDKLSIFCPAAPYPHKALVFIPKYARALVDLGLSEFQFVLTVAKRSRVFKEIMDSAHEMGVSDKITTIGSYSYEAAYSKYARSDVVFVPSLLETYSATYLEAFAANRPLVVANRGFAIDVCGDAALYVDPHSPSDVSQKILSLVNSSELVERLVQKGKLRLDSCETQSSRIDKICAFLLSVA